MERAFQSTHLRRAGTIMFPIQIVFASVFLIAGAYVSVMNWMVVIQWIVHRKHSSWIPLAGGVLSTIGLVTLPYPALRSFWWLPLALDWGCLPGLAYSGVAFAYLAFRRKL